MRTTNRGDGTDHGILSMGEYPGSLGSVSQSSEDGVVKLGPTQSTTDYTIDVANKTSDIHICDCKPRVGSVINIRAFAISGENYRVLNTFTGDGSTTTVYATATRAMTSIP